MSVDSPAFGERVIHGRRGRLHPDIVVELRDDALATVVAAYWLVDPSGAWVFKAAEVAELAGWPAHQTAARVRTAGTARDRTSACPSCGQGATVSSRSDLTGRYSYRGGYLCERCREQAAKEAAERRKQELQEDQRRREELAAEVADVYQLRDEEPPDLETAPLRHVIALLALLRRGDNDLVRTLPLTEWTEPYASGTDGSVERVGELWRAGLLRVHPASDLSAFGYTSDRELGVYIDRASFTVAGSGPTGPRNAQALCDLHEVIAGAWSQRWRADVVALVDEVLLSDALEYLKLQMSEHGFELKAGDRTRLALTRALESFSLGAVYSFIYRAAVASAAYYQRSDVPKAQAANSVVSRIDSSTDRALAERWEVKAYRRDWRLPIAVLTSTLFTTALGIADVMAASPEQIRLAIDRKQEGDAPVSPQDPERGAE